jgi:hypothetical protein
MTDEELLRVAANQKSLVPVAHAALVAELRKRGKELVVPVLTAEGATDSGRWWWPVISDAKSAAKVATYGTTAAFAYAALTGILAVISIFKPLSKPLDYMEPNSIVDAFIFAFLGFMIQRKTSRVAAGATVVMYLLEVIYAGIKGRLSAGGIPLEVIILWALISGVRGTFAYHEHFKWQAPQASGSSA